MSDGRPTPSPRLRVTPFFRWFDLWIGAYVDAKNKTLYVCPLPTLGLKIELRTGHKEIVPGCIVVWDETDEIFQVTRLEGSSAWIKPPNGAEEEGWVPTKELRRVA